MGAPKTKPRKYLPDVEIGGETWTDAEIDRVLDGMLTLIYQPAYDARCSAIAEELGRGYVDPHTKRRSPQPIQVLLWKLATGYTAEYRNYRRVTDRPDRSGMDFSWMEDRMIKWAFSPNKDAQRQRDDPPDYPHVARLLRRHPAEVRDRWGVLSYGGIEGFDLT